jgi:DNA-binding response OmpR family regulator
MSHAAALAYAVADTAPPPPALPLPRTPPADPVLFYDGPKAAIVGGILMLFSPREYALLRALCAGAGVMQSPAELAARLDATHPTPLGAIRVLVCRLRRKLAGCGVLGMIVSARGAGYGVTFDHLPLAR